MPTNDAYLVQIEGWRGAVRQVPAPASWPVASQVLPPIVSMAVRVIGNVGNKAAA